MERPTYALRANLAPESASLTSLLATAGLRRPDTGLPLSEGMVLGIGGGLGMGYILWEFKAHSMRALVMGMRNKWQYAMSLPEKVEARLGVRFAVAETAGARGAQAALDAALALGRPAMVWVDAAHLPYRNMPASMDGVCGHEIVAYAEVGDEYLVDDRAEAPFRLTRADLEAARGRISSYRNRLLTVDTVSPFDLAAAVREGIADCAAHLAGDSDSFSLPVLRKWARLMTDTRNAKGWPRVFADGQGLFSTLASVFDAVTDYGTTGGTLRALYATFLEDAADLLATPALRDVAAHYRMLALRWGTFGECALPTEVAPLAQAKALIARRHMVYTAQGGRGIEELAEIGAELESLRATCDRTFPLDATKTQDLFMTMQAQIARIYEAEVEANRALRAAIA